MKNFILFFGSLIFYAWGEPVYVALILFSTLSDYTHGIWIEKMQERGRKKAARNVMISAVTINLLLLGFFKYSDFLILTVNDLLGTTIPLLHLPLPLGISFYTFQTMSYSIDVYRGKVKAQKNILDFGTFVTLFPQLVAGPIVQYGTIAEQLTDRSITLERVWQGGRRFIIGLGKKVILANQIGLLFETVTGGMEMTVLSAWTAAVAFSFQIYFDFSGYSDMAIGMGKMFGFSFLENFNYPYISGSITEFWRRWHISLSSWFRDYVYIPLGGNRKGKAIQLRNILIVWALTGIWHGASWNFLLWGLWFALFLIVEKLAGERFLKIPALLRHVYTLTIVAISWVIFSFTDMAVLGNWLKALVGLGGVSLFTPALAYELGNYALLFLILLIGVTPLPRKAALYFQEKIKGEGLPGMGKWMVEMLVLLGIFFYSVALIVDASYNPFLYFRF